MKPICAVLIISCCFLTSLLKAQSTAVSRQPVINELVIEVPRADLNKTLPLIKAKLQTVDGTSFEGFCESRKLLFVKADEDSFFNVLMMMKDLNLVYYIKQNTSFLQAQKSCDSMQEIKTSLTTE